MKTFNTFTKTNTFLNTKTMMTGVVALSMLALTACDTKTGEQDTKKSVEAETETVVETTAAAPQELCKGDKLKSIVAQSVDNMLTEKTKQITVERAEKSGLKLDPEVALQKVSSTKVEIKNIQPSATQASNLVVSCQVELNVTLDGKTISQANKRFAYHGQPNLADQLAAQQIELKDNVLVKVITFDVDAQSAVPLVKSESADFNIVHTVSDTLAAATAQDRKDVIVAKKAAQRAAQKAKKQAQQRKSTSSSSQSASSYSGSNKGSSLSKGMNTSIEAKPQVSDVAPQKLAVPDAENITLEITEGTDTY